MAQNTVGHIFMSYSRRDEAVMRRILMYLREQGINVWVDHEKLTPGTAVWEAKIEKALTSADALIVLLSPDSRNSRWVRREIGFAEQFEKPVFPVLVGGDEDTSIPIRLITNQYVDLRQDEETGLQSLSRAILSYLEEARLRKGQTQAEAQQLATLQMQKERMALEKAKAQGEAFGVPASKKQAPARSPVRIVVIAGIVLGALAALVCGTIVFIPILLESRETNTPTASVKPIISTNTAEPFQSAPPTATIPSETIITPASSSGISIPLVIDGFIDEGEWQAAYFIYSLPHGILHCQNDNDYLYILIDLTEDTSDDLPRDSAPWGDYFSFTFDVNENGAIDENVDISYGLPGSYSLMLSYYLGPGAFTSLFPTTSQLGVGFGPSLNSSTPHRFWELAFDLNEIQASPGQRIRFGLTTYSETPTFMDYIPSDYVFDFSDLIETELVIP